MFDNMHMCVILTNQMRMSSKSLSNQVTSSTNPDFSLAFQIRCKHGTDDWPLEDNSFHYTV